MNKCPKCGEGAGRASLLKCCCVGKHGQEMCSRFRPVMTRDIAARGRLMPRCWDEPQHPRNTGEIWEALDIGVLRADEGEVSGAVIQERGRTGDPRKNPPTSDIVLYDSHVLLVSHQGDPGPIPVRVTPDFRKWESCRTITLVGGSSRDLPFPPPFHSGAVTYSPQSPPSALKTSLLSVAQIFSLTHSTVYPKTKTHIICNVHHDTGCPRNRFGIGLICCRICVIQEQVQRFSFSKLTSASISSSGLTTRLPRRQTGFDPRRGRTRNFACGISFRTMPLTCGFSRGSAVSPALAFRRCSMFTSLRPHRFPRPRCEEPPESLHSIPNRKLNGIGRQYNERPPVD
ncbi:hypothetical protein PR048_000802 [Dryococelus australis]|uniref:Uncharacterized protein n=1 Tax=Dryococelus australis TaxID=614101 RepID=A0ABQ9IFP7_9NEOP|nr:hypothetical protein PR048_000802 [Dryococelus australis]